VHALVGVDTHRARIGEPECTPGQHPVPHEIVQETVPQLEFQHLAEPSLRHIQDEEDAGDDEEHAELSEKVMQVAP